MHRIKAILVDDEESARDVLENLLRRFCPDVELLAKCVDVPQAAEAIGRLKPDLVFLDIRMPNYAGYELVRFFEDIDFEMIFVTAHDQYAIRAFEVAAVDYLLKPIDIARLQAAVARAKVNFDRKQQAERMQLLSNTLASNTIQNILVHERGSQHVVQLAHVVAIEAQESYCIVHTEARKYVVSKNLKHFETMLATVPDFFRVHKSWLVNLQHLQHYNKAEMSIHLRPGLVAKLSKYKVAGFEQMLHRR